MLEVPFETLVDRGSIAYLVVDRRGQIQYANRRVSDLLGYEVAELVGQPVEMLLPVALRSKHVDLRNDYLLKPHERQMGSGRDLAACAKDGQEVPVEIGLFPIQGEPEPLIAVTLIGIEDRLAQQEIHARNSRLESVGFLAGGLAHDFNNVLASIALNAELLKASLGSPQTPTLFARIQKSIAHGSSLARRLVTFSKGGAPVLHRRDLGKLVQEVAQMAAAGSGVLVTCRIAPHLPLAFVDETQFTQVITNLVINAVQAMNQSGNIVIEAQDLQVEKPEVLGLEKPGPYLRFVFSDDGPGVSSSVRDKIFEPFFTTKETGSGLGLAMAASILKQHGGSIKLGVPRDGGAVFEFYLPSEHSRDRTDPEFHSEEGELNSCGDQGRVLVLDDEDSIRVAIAEYLRTCGYLVDETASGSEALDWIRKADQTEQPYDAAVLDVMIPGDLGGLEVAQALRQIGSKLPVILMTGYSEKSSESWVTGRVQEVLTKPFTMATLSKALARWTRQKPGASLR